MHEQAAAAISLSVDATLRHSAEWGELASLAREGRRVATPANFCHIVRWAKYNQIFSLSKTLELYIFISYL